MVDISIVILTKNGQKYIREILQAIFSQKTTKKFEIVIIDSGSKDKTLDICKKYPVRIKEVPPLEFNHGETRNLGAKIAKGKFVVYLTQDATPANKYWLENLILPFKKDPLIIGTYSRHVPRKECNPILARQIKYIYPTGSGKSILKKSEDLRKYKNNLSHIIHFSDSSSAILRSMLHLYPFPKTAFAEDIQWEIKVLQAGYKTFYVADSMVYHSHDYSLIEQIRQNYDYMRAVKKILIPTRGKSRQSARILDFTRLLLITLINDVRYILFETEENLLTKLKWILYSPVWHLAVRVGSILGLVDGILPSQIKNRLSRQENLKKQ